MNCAIVHQAKVKMFACFMSPEEREQFRISREIQRMIDQDKKQQDKELKLLLLGTLLFKRFLENISSTTYMNTVRT